MRGVVTAQHDAILPAAEIADHLEVGRAWRDARRLPQGEPLGETPEHAMHGHQQIVLTDLSNARPLGVPAVRPVVAVARFGQAKLVPFAILQKHQH